MASPDVGRSSFAAAPAHGNVLYPPSTTRNRSIPRRLRSRTVAVRALTRAELDAMWRVFAAYYAEVTREMFERDLAEKQDVILLCDLDDDVICGFSTLETYDVTVGGRRVVALFSGDTVVDRAYWGQKALHSAFLRYSLLLKLRNPLCPVYWFLITKGYKTYLLLSRNFPEHWPRFDQPTPPWQHELLDTLARNKFGSAWDPGRGVVRFERSHGRLKSAVAPIGEELLRAADVRFFVERNPGHQLGDELCCIGRLGFGLVAPYFTKLLRRSLPRLANKRLAG